MKKWLSIFPLLMLVINCHQNTNQSSIHYPEYLGAPPGTYIIKENRNTVSFPFEFYGMNLMVQARMNDIPIHMLIDNGVLWDELLFYGSPQVDSLGMQKNGEVLVVGAGEDEGVQSNTASNVSIAFGDVSFSGQNAVITPKEQGFADYFPGVAGQVCGAFFKHFMVDFNFDTQMLTLHQPDHFSYHGKGNFVPMIRDSSGSYSIPVQLKVNNKPAFDYRLFIDLGGIYPVSMVVGDRIEIEKPAGEKTLLGYGASGAIHGYHGILESLKIGGYELKDVASVMVESAEGGDHTNTTVGLPILMRFNLVFDYFNERLYLEPNSHFNDPYDE